MLFHLKMEHVNEDWQRTICCTMRRQFSVMMMVTLEGLNIKHTWKIVLGDSLTIVQVLNNFRPREFKFKSLYKHEQSFLIFWWTLSCLTSVYTTVNKRSSPLLTSVAGFWELHTQLFNLQRTSRMKIKTLSD
jgi:hypothetical protein